MSDSARGIGVLKEMNWLLTAAMAALAAIGVVFVYSACYARTDAAALWQRQMKWIAVGTVGYLAAAALDYRLVRIHAGWIYVVSVVLLVLVLAVGDVVYGARRWLTLFGVGLQPSELAKLALIAVIAWYLSRPGHPVRSIGTTLTVLALVAVPAFLVLREPDLGTTIVMIPIALTMMFVGGVKGKHLAVLIVLALVAAGLVIGALMGPRWLGLSESTRERVHQWTGLDRYQRERILVFFEPNRDPLGAGWNKIQSEIAVGSGGLKGKGYLKGTQNMLGFLPKTVAPTDFIFSVVAEETGFMGSAVVISLFAVILACVMATALLTEDRLGRLLCAGVAAMLFSHVFVNISMTVGLMPVTGLPLPLVSYGGSFVVVTMTALGIVQSVYIRRHRRPAMAHSFM